MERQETIPAARAITDGQDRLLTADGALVDLQERCGGTLPGALAVPSLLELVREAREMGLRIARDFSAYDGESMISGFVRISPVGAEAGGGCEVLVENWHQAGDFPVSTRATAERLDQIDREAAEIIARLDAKQNIQFMATEADDAAELSAMVADNPKQLWSDYVQLDGVSHQQPLHWRLLDGVTCSIPGSARKWRARLLPLGSANENPRGFELLFVTDEPVSGQASEGLPEDTDHTRLIGSALTPVLRQPIARIIANAETIRAKLAGPLRTEYSEYAGNIAAAGQHLSAMLDDLVDLEVVEDPEFVTAREKVDLADAARRAAGILGVRAQARSIKLDVQSDGEQPLASAEFRRVLQVLINLIGNAIAYSPEGSTVTVSTSSSYAGTVSVSVADEGRGISDEESTRIFDKFERLGRDSNGGADTGSGLGLYISRKLARAMNGDLALGGNETDKAGGAEFILSLPAFDQA